MRAAQLGVLTRLSPSTTTLGYLSSRMTFCTVPTWPLSLPATTMTVSPRSTFHLLDWNMACVEQRGARWSAASSGSSRWRAAAGAP